MDIVYQTRQIYAQVFWRCIIKRMGIIVNQQDNRTELQKKVAAELADKAKKKKAREDELPDGVEDSAYIQGTQHTGRLAWVWIVIAVVVVVGAVLYFAVGGNN